MCYSSMTIDDAQMTTPIAISVANISKVYKLYDKPVDRLKESLHPFRKCYHREFYALKDVSFSVKKGETVGIIGRNGAGKSTLLKIITGVLTPTSGSLTVNGKVSSLLELGIGFNPELTGLENIRFSGMIIGYSHEEMEEKTEAVISFADIGGFINQPVKTYSSGMMARLAFALQISVDPDILIVDEALSVGDLLFHAKCMDRMRRLMESGVTILFVSHDIGSVQALCQRAVLLDQGAVVQTGSARDVTGVYTRIMHGEINNLLESSTGGPGPAASSETPDDEVDEESAPPNAPKKIAVALDEEVPFPSPATRYGDGGARILDVKMLDADGNILSRLGVKECFTIQMSVRFDRNMPTFAFGYSFRDLKGQMIVGGSSTNESFVPSPVRQGEVYILEISSRNILKPGAYSIAIGIEMPVVLNEQHLFLDVIENAVILEVGQPVKKRDIFYSFTYNAANFTAMKAKGRATADDAAPSEAVAG